MGFYVTQCFKQYVGLRSQQLVAENNSRVLLAVYVKGSHILAYWVPCSFWLCQSQRTNPVSRAPW